MGKKENHGERGVKNKQANKRNKQKQSRTNKRQKQNKQTKKKRERTEEQYCLKVNLNTNFTELIDFLTDSHNAH